MDIEEKLSILADAAKYDVSCASSGSSRTNTRRGLGNTAPAGVCHSFTADGRCVSLLKILYTNFCIYDCAYCANRSSNDIPRAAFTPRELVELTIRFYRRNFIEGLFLSSGVIRSPDDTTEQLIRVVKDLRSQGFNGYIHMKCVPHASRRLIRKAGRYADRLSVNIELPSEPSLVRLTMEKTYPSVMTPMAVIRDSILETREDQKRIKSTPAFAPAGQSTQLIVGASPEPDYDILHLAHDLYRQQSLKRVYYSAFIPPSAALDSRLPKITAPPLKRENRLYQADWLMRLYGFALDEIITAENPNLDAEIDPKLAFAIRNPQLFPIDINTADYEMILKVPGIGLQSAKRIVHLRRRGKIRYEHLQQMGVVLKRAFPFVTCAGRPSNPLPVKKERLPNGMILPFKRPTTANVPSNSTTAAGITLLTDGTFDGLLSTIFTAYANKITPDAVHPRKGYQQGLFDEYIEVETDPEKSERVWNALKRHLGAKQRSRIYYAFLSNTKGVETIIYRYLHSTLPPAGKDGDRASLTGHIEIEKLSQKVEREAHRMKGFLRFARVKDDLYFALINPRYDILPLIRQYFEDRYTDQQWIIYDDERDYGFYYDGGRTLEIRLNPEKLASFTRRKERDETQSQELWRRYFSAVNISQRNNRGLQIRQLPRRYWQYLPEMKQR